MTSRFDPHSSWHALRDRAAETENPLHKRLVQAVADHMEAEIKARFEPLMATLTAEPVYHFWRLGPGNATLQGYDEVAAFYQNMFAHNGQQFQVVAERILVDDGGVVTEGKVRSVYKANALAEMGVTTVADQPISSHELWLSNTQLITVWPTAPDGKLMGEDIYFGEDPMSTLQPIGRDELPAYFIF